MAKSYLSWPLGIIAAPFFIVWLVIVCIMACFGIVLAALLGKIELKTKDLE